MLHKIVLGICCLDLKEQLAVCGSEVDSTYTNGITPLIWAAIRGDSHGVDHLLRAKADPRIVSNSGATAISAAVISGNQACLKLILAAIPSLDLISAIEESDALHHAVRFHNSGEIIKTLTVTGIDCNKINRFGNFPLGMAGMSDHDITATVLIDCGADINLLDGDGNSALVSSVFYNSSRVTELLLSRGANYTLRNSNGDSILHLLAKSGDDRILEIMLAARLHGIDPEAVNRSGKTSLQLAQEHKNAPEGFIENLHNLLTDIRTRNATFTTPTHETTTP